VNVEVVERMSKYGKERGIWTSRGIVEDKRRRDEMMGVCEENC
jgi:hypothetical protein